MNSQLLDRIATRMLQSQEGRYIDIGMECTKDEILLILWVEQFLASAVHISRTDRTNFISMADSTGFGRGYNKDFIRAVVQSLPGFAVCFSHPRPELIFGKSSLNSLKVEMGSQDLYRFWKSCFENRCECAKNLYYVNQEFTGSASLSSHLNLNRSLCYFSTWSGFESNRAYPYTSIEEIESFEDDPVTKMKDEFEDISDLFEGILFRKDFTKGGLLFSNKICGDICEENQKECSSHSRIKDMISALRSYDFSTELAAQKSSLIFDTAFDIYKVRITPTGSIKSTIKGRKEDVRVIKPKKI